MKVGRAIQQCLKGDSRLEPTRGSDQVSCFVVSSKSI